MTTSLTYRVPPRFTISLSAESDIRAAARRAFHRAHLHVEREFRGIALALVFEPHSVRQPIEKSRMAEPHALDAPAGQRSVRRVQPGLGAGSSMKTAACGSERKTAECPRSSRYLVPVLRKSKVKSRIKVKSKKWIAMLCAALLSVHRLPHRPRSRPPFSKPTDTDARQLGSWKGTGSTTLGFVSESGSFRINWTTRNQDAAQPGSFQLTLRSGISGRPIKVIAEHTRGGRRQRRVRGRSAHVRISRGVERYRVVYFR